MENNTTENSNGLQLDIDYLRTLNLHCAVVTNGTISDRAFMSFIKFSNVARQLDLDWSVQTVNQNTNNTLARNALISSFLNQKEKSHLAIIDADLEWEPWHLLSLANHRVEVIGGLYSQCSLPLRWMIDPVDNNLELDKLTEVKKLGCGFVLLSRAAAEKMLSHLEVVSCGTDVQLEDNAMAKVYTYFNSAIVDGVYYDEESNFCRKWQECGGKLWVDTRVLLSRIGNFSYSAVEQDKLTDILGPVYVKHNAAKLEPK